MEITKDYHFNVNDEDSELLTCIHEDSKTVSIMTGGAEENNIYLNMTYGQYIALYKQMATDIVIINQEKNDAS